MDSVHRHSYSERRKRPYTTRSIDILLFTLQILFSRFISFRASFRVVISFFANLPLPLYIFSFTLGLYRIDIGVFLAL